MPINSTINIMGTVGRRGRNSPNDVRVVQTRLNELARPPRSSLKVDGKCGPATEGVIADFQKVVCGSPNPDGRVDPGKKTHAALNDPASEGKWARMSIGAPAAQPGPAGGGNVQGLSPSQQKVAKDVEDAARKADQLGVYAEFLKQTPVANLKKVLDAQGALANFIQLFVVAREQRALGSTVTQIAEFMSDATKMKDANGFAKILEASKRNPQMFKSAKVAGRAAGGISLFLGAAEMANHLEKRQYGAAAAEVYGVFMSAAVPWAGFLSAVQNLAFTWAPGLRGMPAVNYFFRMLNARDPVGLGKIAIDSFVTIIDTVIVSFQRGQLDTGQLELLVERMRNSPSNILVSAGEWLGDTAFDGVSGGKRLFDGLLEHLRK